RDKARQGAVANVLTLLRDGAVGFIDWLGRCSRSQFLQAIQRARGKARVSLVKVIEKAGKKDWKAAAWHLSHVWPNEYSEQTRVDVGLLGGIVLLPAKEKGAE